MFAACIIAQTYYYAATFAGCIIAHMHYVTSNQVINEKLQLISAAVLQKMLVFQTFWTLAIFPPSCRPLTSYLEACRIPVAALSDPALGALLHPCSRNEIAIF